jgi:hypothetical protein
MKALSFPLIAALVVSMAAVPAFAQATNDGQAWRTLAETLEGGVAIEMRLRDGRHFKATFVAAHPDAMVVQRKTRLPVAVEPIAYDSIASLSRVQPFSMSGAKVAGIALGSAGAAVGTLFLILLATID